MYIINGQIVVSEEEIDELPFVDVIRKEGLTREEALWMAKIRRELHVYD